MVETTLNRMLYCLFVFALFCGTSFAQSAAPAIAHTTHSGIVTPAQPTPATLKTIFTNLGPSKTDDYNDTAGLYIMGQPIRLATPSRRTRCPSLRSPILM
jgi:hypothetical protein